MKRLLKTTFLLTTLALLCACNDATKQDINRTKDVGNKLTQNQPTPTDIDYSLERYNLIRRAYWVNGEKERARAVARPSQVPMGYCVLFTEMGQVLGQFNVDGKVSSMNSYLTGSYYYTSGYQYELPDIDGSYGENDKGIFFFTPQWQYIEWNGTYLYSDTPFKISETILGDY